MVDFVFRSVEHVSATWFDISERNGYFSDMVVVTLSHLSHFDNFFLIQWIT